MGKTEELTATDKLLQVIKGKEGEAAKSSPTLPSTPHKKSSSTFKIPHIFSNKEKKSINIGIDLGKNHLRLVKATRKSSREWKILDMSSFPYPNGITKGSYDYKHFIEGKIKSFCNPGECNLWAISYSQNVEVRHLRIPKVAKKEISNAVYWTFKKEFPYDESEFAMDYEIQDEVIVGGSAKLSVMAYISPKSEIDTLKIFYSDMGLTLAGITIHSFAVQNILRTAETISEDTLAFLNIGDDSSRIDIYSRGNLAMTRVIKAGTGSMAEALCDGLRESHQDCSYEDAVEILRRMSTEAGNDQIEKAVGNLSREQIFGFLGPALDRVVRQAERTFDYYATHFGAASVKTVMVSGEMIAYEPLAGYFGNQLGLAFHLFDPAGQGLLDNVEPLSGVELAERVAFISALGAACSDKHLTPNLLFGHRDREVERSIKQLNRGVLAGFAVLAVFCMGYFIYQNLDYSQKKAELKTLESKLSSFGLVIDKNVLMAMSAQIQKNTEASRSYAERYHSMAILSEISTITPREIKLIRCDFGATANSTGEVTDKSKGGSANKSEITIEGIIQGERSSTESLLTGYTFKLDSSPLFESITIQKSNYVPFIGREALQFVLSAKIS